MDFLLTNDGEVMLLTDGAATGETAATGEGAAATPATGGWTGLLLSFGVLILVFYLFLLRPQKKQEKAQKQLQDSLQVGDEIVTNGGIVGIVVSIKEDTVVIETGSDRSKVRIKRWAIQSNQTIHDD